ncbi:HPr(Ser) kinase/phosphatase [Myxococcota bacterium]|jgi:HPr kinase/phosphorylase|nr:HPr(Ser) kinase/phosphatase [Myxococcota bacterium]MBU1413497.1 HPr(Ser) kinase/phosphatase [Myxococcota bacterium]MBU1510283.1 HPr(Ser) kinase/phosphatase [Myxococcota bacterium]PKN26368.1 MAG: HPr(Ser) kinase/phosphatase [Deltaproteobacteria bacterium HGW-Deltaproteobacteria-22]
MSRLTVRNLLEDAKLVLQLKCLAGAQNLWKDVTEAHIMKAGLLLAGVERDAQPNSIIVLGQKEISYFEQLKGRQRSEPVRQLIDFQPSCIIVTKNLPVPRLLVTTCLDQKIPLFSTPLLTSRLLDNLESWIDENTRESMTLHGVLVDVLGIGVLIQGPSGIGKSEVALELISRGHRLVADDLVEIQKQHGNHLMGQGRPLVSHHMEIRGLGIVSIPALFGPTAVRDSKRIESIVDLEDWDPKKEYDRLGIDEQHRSILDVRLPLLTIPVRPGRSVATIIEVAARDRLLKERGIHSARLFHDQLDKVLSSRAVHPAKGIE